MQKNRSSLRQIFIFGAIGVIIVAQSVGAQKIPATSITVKKLRDPFEPKLPVQAYASNQQEEIKLPELVVSGVVWGSQVPQAIINDIVVKKGDIIKVKASAAGLSDRNVVASPASDDIFILNITRDTLEVRYRGKMFTVKTTFTAEIPKQLPAGRRSKKN